MAQARRPSSEHLDSSLFLLPLDENLICSICLGVLSDPLQCQNGHNYCRVCLDEYLEDGPKPCPMRCTAILYSADDCIKNRAIAGIVDNLIIQCPSKQCISTSDCVWTGTIQSWKRQHRKKCLFENVMCEFEGCCDKILRKNLVQHQQYCAHRQTPCVWCHTLLSQKQSLVHYCEEELLPCPHACFDSNGNVKQCLRRDMQNHLLFDCPEEVIACPFTPLGCQTTLPRKEMLHHQLNTGVEGHQTMLLSKVLQQEIQLAQQQKSIYELSSLAHTEIIFSIQNFNRSQSYFSPTVEFLGRQFQVSFASNMTFQSHHNIVLTCSCDMPTHLNSLTGSLHQKQPSTSHTSISSTTNFLLVEKTSTNVYFPPYSTTTSYSPAEFSTTAYREVQAIQQVAHRTSSISATDLSSQVNHTCDSGVWELGNFIKTEDLLSCVNNSPESSLVISVKLSIHILLSQINR